MTTSHLASVLDEVGLPAGWYPLLEGDDQLPMLPDGLTPPREVVDALAEESPRSISSENLSGLKRRLQAMYKAGWGADVEAGERSDNTPVDDEEDAEAAVVPGTRIHIPTETFIEELSQRLEIHPISVYWLLRELREREGINSLSELRSYIEDYFTVMILRLFGYRWPTQIEVEEPVPEWADQDGIIPLTDGTGQRTLLDRVRERIAADFGEARVDTIEQEFRQMMDRSLVDWLARDFFPHHISQFKRRPITWLLESGRAVDTRWETTRSRRVRRPSRSGGPACACLVYYHKLTADSLTRIKTRYLRLILQRRAFELAEERRRVTERNIAARASAERLAEIVDELNAFEAALDTVRTQGFSSQRSYEITDSA